MVIILSGVSGSGKTTIGIELSQQMGYQFLDADDFHPDSNIKKMSSGIPLTEADRLPWLTSLRRRIEEYLESGEDLVLACSALSRASRDRLRADDDNVRIVYLQGEKDLIRQRLQSREGHFVGAELLDSQFDALEEPNEATVVCISRSPRQIVAQIINELRLVL